MMMNPDKPVCGSNGDCIIGFGLSKYLICIEMMCKTEWLYLWLISDINEIRLNHFLGTLDECPWLKDILPFDTKVNDFLLRQR